VLRNQADRDLLVNLIIHVRTKLRNKIGDMFNLGFIGFSEFFPKDKTSAIGSQPSLRSQNEIEISRGHHDVGEF
jgi:hypothetical protein